MEYFFTWKYFIVGGDRNWGSIYLLYHVQLITWLSLVIGHWSIVIGHWSIVIGHCSVGVDEQPRISEYHVCLNIHNLDSGGNVKSFNYC
ncbi:hypothetical protein NIES2100_64150 [Calothrix sp. NIES-2100]|uniref:hypothetical protein n=1 Tax=Calothrix sp. NIES-2100 TaxID=1954172 RepID=UPI000B612DCD|nr:hypothetical protein NIES2100_64150 [Calothrix sp. NIES-2100]